MAIRNYPETAMSSQTLDELIAENNSVIAMIETKVKNIVENYKVQIGHGKAILVFEGIATGMKGVQKSFAQRNSN